MDERVKMIAITNSAGPQRLAMDDRFEKDRVENALMPGILPLRPERGDPCQTA
jgi:hypothetical protein